MEVANIIFSTNNKSLFEFLLVSYVNCYILLEMNTYNDIHPKTTVKTGLVRPVPTTHLLVLHSKCFQHTCFAMAEMLWQNMEQTEYSFSKLMCCQIRTTNQWG